MHGKACLGQGPPALLLGLHRGIPVREEIMAADTDVTGLAQHLRHAAQSFGLGTLDIHLDEIYPRAFQERSYSSSGKADTEKLRPDAPPLGAMMLFSCHPSEAPSSIWMEARRLNTAPSTGTTLVSLE